MHHWELLGSCLVYRAQPGGAVFNPNQVTGDCAPAFSSWSRLHVDIMLLQRKTCVLGKGEHSIPSCSRTWPKVKPGPRDQTTEIHWSVAMAGMWLVQWPRGQDPELKGSSGDPTRLLTALPSQIWHTHTHTRAGLGSRQLSPEEGRQLCLETHILENDPCVMKAMGASQEGRHHGQLQRSVCFRHRPLRLGGPWGSLRDYGGPRAGSLLAGNATIPNVWHLVFIKWLLYDNESFL